MGPLKPRTLPFSGFAAAAALALPGLATAAPALELLHTQWPSEWIACAGAEGHAPGVYHFRKHVTLAEHPPHFVVHVSADSRFILYVNGHRVGDGPARADLAHWRYETFDLAPYLTAGSNLLAATVWNYGAAAPLGQPSDQTAFLMQGDT